MYWLVLIIAWQHSSNNCSCVELWPYLEPNRWMTKSVLTPETASDSVSTSAHNANWITINLCLNTNIMQWKKKIIEKHIYLLIYSFYVFIQSATMWRFSWFLLPSNTRQRHPWEIHKVQKAIKTSNSYSSLQ